MTLGKSFNSLKYYYPNQLERNTNCIEYMVIGRIK